MRFQKCMDLAVIPSDWSLVRLTLDWNGHPLLLFADGKPPQADFQTDREAWRKWYQTPPNAHHLVFLEAEKLQSITFDQSRGLSTLHVQRFEDGWLLGERRGGRATVHDASGTLRFSLDLGDASEDLQTTKDGYIWVSYFDEGVFGQGISRQGLVCFDGAGKQIFKYADFAEHNAMPMICDCYAMNVDETGAVWVNYYTDFPLVRLRNFEVERVWEGFGVLGNSFAVGEDEVVYMRDKQLFLTGLLASSRPGPRVVGAEDESGNVLTPIAQPFNQIAARGASLALNTGDAIYTTCL